MLVKSSDENFVAWHDPKSKETLQKSIPRVPDVSHPWPQPEPEENPQTRILLARTMKAAVTFKLIAKKELTRVIVDAVLCAAGYNIRWLLRMIVK